MATVKKALVERPALQVDVPMAYSAELDGGLIESQALDASLAKLAGSQKKLLGGRPDEEEVAAMLADPEQRFELLAKHYRAEAGAEAPLPGEAAAFEALKKKERTPEALAAANEAMARTPGSTSIRRRPNRWKRSARRAGSRSRRRCSAAARSIPRACS